MAEFDGVLGKGMTDQAGSAGARLIEFPQPNPPPQWQAETLNFDKMQALAEDYQDGPFQHIQAVALVSTRAGLVTLGAGDETWFENVFAFPRRIDAGLVLVTQVFQLDLYNAYRLVPRVFTSFVNNVGGGIVITNLPALPFTLQEQRSLALTLNVLADGPPRIAGTLDFAFDDGTVMIVLTGDRAILLIVEPVVPVVEILEFLTDVVLKRDGKEQRISLRANPRQSFDLVYEIEGFDRGFLETRLFGGQDRSFGIPVWHEPSLLTIAIQIGNTVATVDSTAFADFRVDDLAIAFVDTDNFEVLDVQSLTATTITFTSAFTRAFPVGTRVMPIRNVRLSPTTRGEKFPRKLQRTRLLAEVLDNPVGLASTAAFPSFSGKVLLDDGNRIESSLGESFERRIQEVDSETGLFETTSYETASRRGSIKTFFTRTRQRLWEVRQLLHALRGRAVSFYLPTFFDEFVLTQPITSGSATLVFRNVGFADFVGVKLPRNALRVVLRDGTKIARTILTATEIDSLTEQVTVDAAWGVNAAIADVDYVDFVEKVRIDSDEVRITHLNSPGQATIELPIKAVLM